MDYSARSIEKRPDVTDEERREAEERHADINFGEGVFGEARANAWFEGFEAACEAKRAEIETWKIRCINLQAVLADLDCHDPRVIDVCASIVGDQYKTFLKGLRRD